jgi:hypothetical protein
VSPERRCFIVLSALAAAGVIWAMLHAKKTPSVYQLRERAWDREVVPPGDRQ